MRTIGAHALWLALAAGQPTAAAVDAPARGLAVRALRSGPIDAATSCQGVSASSLDATVAFNSCAALAVAQGRPLYLSTKIVVDGVRLPSYVQLDCGGAGGFIQKAGGTGGADGQAYTVAFADPTAMVRVGMNRCEVDGNAANQTAMIGGVSWSNDGATGPGGDPGAFIPRHSLTFNYVHDTSGTCIRIGPLTRDSVWIGNTAYRCGLTSATGVGLGSAGNWPVGLLDLGVDGTRTTFNIGQTSGDACLFTNHAVTLVAFKCWGGGNYNSAFATHGYDGGRPSNFAFFKVSAVTGNNLYSQEGYGYGFRFEGQGSNEDVGLNFTNLTSDGDNVSQNSSVSCFNAFRLRLSTIGISCGKYATGLKGTPAIGGTLSNSSGNRITMNGTGITGAVWNIASDAIDNDFEYNGSKTRTYTGSASATFTGFSPYQYRRYEVTMNGNMTFANPAVKTVGWEQDVVAIEDATGGRTISWGSDFVTTGWFASNCASPVTTANARNVYRWRSDGTNWRITSCQMGQ